MDKPLTVDQAKEIAQSFLQAYYQHFDNGPRENLQSLYVTHFIIKPHFTLNNLN